MKNVDFERFVREFRNKQDELIISKGHDYTVGNGDEDRLWNFKIVGGLLGITPLQALGVYWLKHILAICTYIKMGKVESEDIDGRFLDESNYNLLGRALIFEATRGESLSDSKADRAQDLPSVRKGRVGGKAKKNQSNGSKLSSRRR